MGINTVLLQATPEAATKGIERLFDTFVLFGVLGLITLALGWAVYRLYIKIERLRDAHAEEIKGMNIEIRGVADRSTLLLEKAVNVMTTSPITTADNVGAKVGGLFKGEMAEMKRVLMNEIDIIKRMKCKYEDG